MPTIKQLQDIGAAFAVAEAKRGRFAALAEELKACNVHPTIVAWVQEGCKVERKRGHPSIDPGQKAQVLDVYLRYREISPRDELPEKVLLLALSERFTLGQRAIERIVAEHRSRSIAGIASKLGVSNAEAEAWWESDRTRRWQRWRKHQRSAK